MSKNDPSYDNRKGLFAGLGNHIKLILKLMMDPRVPAWLKALPVVSFGYLLWIPDLAPIIPIDDALVLWLGTQMFIELCPPDIVAEHRGELDRTVDTRWKDSGEVIDGESKDL